jgi:hypothetical protein
VGNCEEKRYLKELLHLKWDALLLAEDEGEVALVVVEVRFEAGNREVLCQLQNSVGHAVSEATVRLRGRHALLESHLIDVGLFQRRVHDYRLR